MTKQIAVRGLSALFLAALVITSSACSVADNSPTTPTPPCATPMATITSLTYHRTVVNNPSQASNPPAKWAVTSDGTLTCNAASNGNTVWNAATATWTCNNPGMVPVGSLVKIVVTDTARMIGSDFASGNVGSEIKNSDGTIIPVYSDTNGTYAGGTVACGGSIVAISSIR